MKYFLWIDEKKQGPYDDEQIRAMLARGEVPRVTSVLSEDGTGDWTPTFLPELVGLAKPLEPPKVQQPPPILPSFINCPACGRHVSREANTCPQCGFPFAKPNRIGRFLAVSKRKVVIRWIAAAILCVCIILPLGGFYKTMKFWDSMEPESETPDQRMSRLRAEGERELLKACTNDVVGLHRVIRTSLDNSDNNPFKWTAHAEVEFVNRFGGIERTNLLFRFVQVLGGVSCYRAVTGD